MNGLARFVNHPEKIEDLLRADLSGAFVPFYVVRVVTLARIDYENFINDMSVERQFLEDNARLCRIGEDGVRHSIFVRHRGDKDGVIVLANESGHVVSAAYFKADG